MWLIGKDYHLAMSPVILLLENERGGTGYIRPRREKPVQWKKERNKEKEAPILRH